MGDDTDEKNKGICDLRHIKESSTIKEKGEVGMTKWVQQICLLYHVPFFAGTCIYLFFSLRFKMCSVFGFA